MYIRHTTGISTHDTNLVETSVPYDVLAQRRNHVFTTIAWKVILLELIAGMKLCVHCFGRASVNRFSNNKIKARNHTFSGVSFKLLCTAFVTNRSLISIDVPSFTQISCIYVFFFLMFHFCITNPLSIVIFFCSI